MNPIKLIFFAPGLLLLSSLMVGQTPASAPTAGVKVAAPASGRSLYLKVQLSGKVKPSSLKPGDAVEGMLAQPVYSGHKEYLPASSRVRLTVDKLERRKRPRNNHWPWVVQVFTPRHENYPAFQSAVVSLPDGKEVPLHVSLISIANKVAVHAEGKSGQNEKGEAGPATAQKAAPGLVMTLQANTLAEDSNLASAEPIHVPAATLATGTGAKIILLDGVSASKSLPGDAFQARLVEPVRVGTAVVLPEGTIFQGKVVRSKRPRWLSRSGSLLLTFTGVTLPGSSAGNPIVASVTGAEVDPASHTKIDSEGELNGSPGKAWMLANIAATGGIAKVADDGIQLLVEALSSTATDASTAGTGRIVALCASGVFMITRHGRDVLLPQFTEMNIVLDRPVSLNLPRSQTE